MTMFVIGSLFTLKPFKLLAGSFVRDIIFYLLGISWIFYLFTFAKEIKLYDGIGMMIVSHLVDLWMTSDFCSPLHAD